MAKTTKKRHMQLRPEPAQLAALKKAAEMDGRSLADWALRTLVAKAAEARS